MTIRVIHLQTPEIAEQQPAHLPGSPMPDGWHIGFKGAWQEWMLNATPFCMVYDTHIDDDGGEYEVFNAAATVLSIEEAKDSVALGAPAGYVEITEAQYRQCLATDEYKALYPQEVES